MIFSLLTVGLLLVAPSHAFWRLTCAKPVLNARVDPIVTFGKPSSHSHTIMGPSTMGLSTTFDDLRNSQCTTCKIKDDRSAYWTPEAYFMHKDGTFQLIDHGGMEVYYLQRGPSVSDIIPFPDGFRVLAGNSNARSRQIGTPLDRAISWQCLNFNGPGIPQTPGLPPQNTSCPSGLRMQVVFPSCWDGINVDSPNHMDHMAYPDGVDNGICPATHPKRFMTVFYEVWLNVSPYIGLDGQIVLSNGDATGFGLHGDFFNGWDSNVLGRAIQTCTAGSGRMEDCPVFMNEGRFNPDDVANACNAPNPIPSEMHTTSDILTHLPGCQKVTYGPAPAVPTDLVPGCDPNVPFVNSGKNTSSNAPPPSSVAHSSSSTMGSMSASSSSSTSSMPSNSPPTMIAPPKSSSMPASSSSSTSSMPSSSPPTVIAPPKSSSKPASSSSSTSSMPSKSPPPMNAPPTSSSKPASSSPPPLPKVSSSSSLPVSIVSNSSMPSNGHGGSSQPVSSTPKPQPSMGTGTTSIKPSSVLPTVTGEPKPSSSSHPHPSSSEKPKPSHHHHHHHDNHHEDHHENLPQHQQDEHDEDLMECGSPPPASTSAAAVHGRWHMHRRHHARRAGHGSQN